MFMDIVKYVKNLFVEGSTYSGATIVTAGLVVLFANSFAHYIAYILIAYGAYKILFSRK